jgi:hypothetical protein
MYCGATLFLRTIRASLRKLESGPGWVMLGSCLTRGSSVRCCRTLESSCVIPQAERT